MKAALSLNRLVKVFGDHRAVDGLSFEVPTGSIFGLLGRNGAGKTTTIRMIMDIIRPDTGEVFVLGSPMNAATKDRIGYLPEERGLYPKMKVLDMLEFLGSIKTLQPAEARKLGDRWLDRLELSEWKQKKLQELSKGMQQKVQFIAAVLAKPDLLILDEPFSGMDPVNQDLFKELLLEIHRTGTTIIFSTHVMASAELLCDDIALIDHGKVVLNGTLDAIKQRFGQNSLIMEFDGDGSYLQTLPEVNTVSGDARYAEIEMHEGADPQNILRASIDRVKLRRFELVSPTLHNIFVQQVGTETLDDA